MNKKKELIILGIVTLVLLVTLGVTYAIFTFSKTSVKSELIAGDIYMKYKETKGISLSNAMPRETYDPNGYFEFTIEGKNTYTEKDIYYDVVLNHGDAPSDANRTIRIEDKYLHFRLVEVVNNEEQEIFQDEKYNNIQNKRIYVNTIPKNTTTNTSHVYRLYMWIGSEVGIGNTEDATYSTRLHVKVRLINKETGEIKEQEIYLGDFPLMTDTGTFVINGAERVVVSQLVRSPGCYYAFTYDKTGKKLFTSTVMPIRGAWLEYETDANDVFYARVDRTRKIPVTVLLRAIGLVTDEQIAELFGDEEKLKATFAKDTIKTQDEALIEIYKKLRPGELPTADAARNLFNGLLFDPRRYDLARVGRYKYNQKLSLKSRIANQISFADIINPETGEVLVEKDSTITFEQAENIQNSGINIVDVKVNDKKVRIIGNGTVDIHKVLPDLDFKDVRIKEEVNYEVLKNIIDNTDSKDLLKEIQERIDELIPKHITNEDIIASINYIFNLDHDLGSVDDIDHLGNRRVRCVGELLQNQFRIGLTRLERVVRERMTIQDLDVVTPQTLINTKPITSSIREFFGSSQLSQFMDQSRFRS